MGMAEEVASPTRPALGAPAPAPTPAPGAANLSGSGSAPIGQGGVGGPAAQPGRMAGLAGRARGLANGAVGKLAVGAAAAQAIGDSMAEGSTDRYATRFGVDAPTGDGSVADIAKFAGLRAGGFASDLGNRLTMGAAGTLYRDNPGEAVAAPAAPSLGAAGNLGAAPGGVGAASAVPAVPQPEKLAGTALNGFPGVRRVDQPNGVPLFTNATTNQADKDFLTTARSGSIGGVGGGPETLAIEQRATDLAGQISLMRAGMRDRGDPNAYLKAATSQAGQQPGGLSAETQAQIDAITRRANGGRISAVGLNAINNLMQNQTQLRGQDMAAENQRAALAGTAATARARIAQDGRELDLKERQFAQGQKNSDRDFDLRGAEFGAKRGDADFGQRDTAQKSIAARFEKQFTTTDDKGKQVVDQARVAKFTTGVQTFLGNKTAELEAKVAAGKATPEDAQMLAKIKAKGPAALDEEDLTNIETNIKRGERLEATKGLVVGSNYVKSNDPNAYGIRGRKQNLFGSDTVEFNNGSSGRAADFEFTEPGNTLLPNVFKTRTDEFDLRGRK